MTDCSISLLEATLDDLWRYSESFLTTDWLFRGGRALMTCYSFSISETSLFIMSRQQTFMNLFIRLPESLKLCERWSNKRTASHTSSQPSAVLSLKLLDPEDQSLSRSLSRLLVSFFPEISQSSLSSVLLWIQLCESFQHSLRIF